MLQLYSSDNSFELHKAVIVLHLELSFELAIIAGNAVPELAPGCQSQHGLQQGGESQQEGGGTGQHSPSAVSNFGL